MRILLSAFACVPQGGSEGGVGWRWAVELVRAGHDVVVITDVTRKSAIDIELAANPVRGLTVDCYRPGWLRSVPLNSTTAQMVYSAWQYSLLPKARELNSEHQFDLVIHLTYGVFRHPSFLGFLGLPFIFGPVGGGEDAPWALKSELPILERVKEAVRTALNTVARFNPFLTLALRRASLVLVRTEDTRSALPRFCRENAKVYQEIGIDISPRAATGGASVRKSDKPLEIIFAGRLLGVKGVHLALRAIAKALDHGHDIRFTIVGSGPLEAWLKSLAAKLGVQERVRWIPRIPQQDLFALYGEMHCLLFPSLHDSGGNVVLEAMAFGLPVVCLNIGGPVTLVDESCAIVVAVQDVDQQVVVDRLAHAIGRLAIDESARQAMSGAACRRAATMTWSSRPAGALAFLASNEQDTADSLQQKERQ